MWNDGDPCFSDVDEVLVTLGVTLEGGLSTTQANTNWTNPFPKPRVGFFGRILGMFGCGAGETGVIGSRNMNIPTVVSVLRNGEWDHGASPNALAVGDVIQLENGTKVPADCRIVKIFDGGAFQTDESMLTGEPEYVTKHIDAIKKGSGEMLMALNMAYMDTLIVTGKALAVVSAVGKYAFLGSTR